MFFHKNICPNSVTLLLGYSPVHLAAQLGDIALLRTLVFGRADADMPDGKSGKTGLHHAVDGGDLSVVAYLLMEVSSPSVSV